MSTNVSSCGSVSGRSAPSTPLPLPSAGGGLAAEQGHKPPTIAPLWCPRKIPNLKLNQLVLYLKQPRTVSELVE